MARIGNVIIGLLLLIVYIMVFIPFILPQLNSMFLDWINAKPEMFSPSWCATHYVYNATTNQFYNYTDCSAMDLRPAVIFVWQFIIYFAIPISLALISLKAK